MRVGGSRTVAEGIGAWNPVFDVTPHELIDAIVTEQGVIEHPDAARDAGRVRRLMPGADAVAGVAAEKPPQVLVSAWKSSAPEQARSVVEFHVFAEPACPEPLRNAFRRSPAGHEFAHYGTPMAELAKEIIPVNLEDEMRRSYLDYAMSVIVGRALPGRARRPEAGAPPRAVRDERTRRAQQQAVLQVGAHRR